ncbi:MAG: N-acetylmuramoyl-L-alanine amidase [Bacteroidales bacterium]|jgi:N-acetylmuramoyl-L-alanine amidase|nr:N-acetylmuramoyl-L-alanine amidase [Bacteroidales bacterium]
MSTVSKNGKVRTYNIYGVILLSSIMLWCCHLPSSAAPKTNGKWVIVIDPGHGGRDPGAVGTFSKEKNITLAIAKKTADYIRENIKDVTVIMTREDDSTVDLYERPRIANKNNADLFISIHANAMPGSKTTMGAETWIMGIASSEENLQVAMKENEVILLEDDYSTKYQGFDPKSPESYIIFTLTQNIFQKQSTELAWKIQTQFRERVNRKDRGVKQAGFVVLYNTTMPSVLVETGFISTPAEERYLNSEQGQDYIASAIYRASRDYMAEVDLRSNVDTKPAAPSTSSTSSTASTTSTTSIPSTTPASPKKPVQNTVTAAKTSSIPSGSIIFTVQVAASSTRKDVSPENFRGIEDVNEVRTGERYRYVTGIFDDYTDAVSYRKKIEAMYPDAFVIALQNNKMLPLQQALENKRKK